MPAAIAAYEKTPICGYIPGFVEKIGKARLTNRQVDMGDLVKKDDILAVLHVPEREAEVRRKKAVVVQTQAELKQAMETLQTARANVKTTEAMIKEETSVRPRIRGQAAARQQEYVRIEKLFKDRIIEKQILDETYHQYKGAEGEVGEIEARIARAKAVNEESLAKKARAEADVDVARLRVDVAQADRDEAQAWLDYREFVPRLTA